MTHPNGHPNGATPLTEAALKLGLSTEVLRKRLTTGQMPGEKVAGRWYVFLPNQDANQDTHQNGNQDESGSLPDESYRLLSEAQREEILFLRTELTARTEELRRKDVIMHELAAQLKVLPAAAVSVQEEHSQSEQPVVASASMSSWWQSLAIRLGFIRD